MTLREVCGLTTEEIARAFLAPRADARAADRARQGEDPRRAHPLRGAGARPSCPTRLDAVLRVDLPRVQRGLCGLGRRVADARRPVGRGDPARPAAGRAAAGARGRGPAGADAAAGFAPRGAHRRRPATSCCSTSRTARCGTARRSPRACALVRARARLAPLRALHAAGGDRRSARARRRPRRPPTGRASSAIYDLLLSVEPSPVVELNRAAAIADARRPGRRARADRRDPRARRSRRLPAGARRPRRPLPAARPRRRRAAILPARARTDPAGTGAALPRAPAARSFG